ncbi:hypothetical protein [Lichenifustis flavocetrariae]|uniref:NlpC/P60 domain-containing protein n=1 Tax=Lichenifustis flavocetrariae TaxID=2949735 RepID=A0AA41YZV6_9HYPH|nr:hypothetical protein [Lichenifustis flavocetrariae]MCW6506732.1 hypothetical protein [Lichenifustis flavocetrariae]
MSRAVLALAITLVFCQITSATADDRLVRRFTSGDGPTAVGTSFSDAGEDQEEDGPQAIATGERGKVFVLDQINSRILTFDPKDTAAAPQALALPPDVRPTDLVVKGADLYVWDGKVHALQPLGPESAPTRGLTETRSAEPVDDTVMTAFAQVGSTDGGDLQGETTRGVKTNRRNDLARQTVSTHGRGTVVASVTLTDRGAGAVLDIQGQGASGVSAKIRLRVRDRLGTVAFLDIDKSGRMYVLAENIPLSIRDTAFAFVARFSPAGVLEGVHEVPLSSTTVSRRCVTVSADGDVYFLKTLKTAVDIIGLGFRATPNAKFVEASRRQPNAAALAWADPKGISMAVGPLTRQKVIQAALSYEGIQWTVTPPVYGADNEACSGFSGRIRVPMYMIGKVGQTVRGVPYCWGCQGSIRQFVDRIQHGTLAGNVCTKDGVRTDVAGVDCSSFVSAAWGLSTHFSTAAIPAIAEQLANPWDLQPGDALDKPGSHVVLFLGFTPNREAQVMEASPGACNGRVCRNIYPLSWLLSRGFIPVRYRALMN